jgi:nucleoside-diphosphate-sugar epimerase
VRIFIAGATGVLGRRLIPALAVRGHHVVGLARSEAKATEVRRLGGAAASASLFEAEELARAADGAEVVIHVATAIPTQRARRKAAWELNDRIRRAGTRALARAAGLIGARRYLQQSVVWVVKRRVGETPFDERTAPDPPALLRSAVDGEETARAAGARYGFGVAVLRAGSFYGPETAHSRLMASLIRRRQLPILGRGEVLLAPLHVADAALAFATAVEASTVGTWNVMDDEPVCVARFLSHFAALLGAPPPRRLPLWIGRLVLGSAVFESLTTSMATSNAAIRRDLGWAPRYPTYREGLAEMVNTWKAESADAAGAREGPG